MGRDDQVILVNLTGDTIRIATENGPTALDPLAEGVTPWIPRAELRRRSKKLTTNTGVVEIGTVADGYRPVNLPRRRPRTLYIVGQDVAMKSRRSDLVFVVENSSGPDGVPAASTLAFPRRPIVWRIRNLEAVRWFMAFGFVSNPQPRTLGILVAILAAVGGAMLGILADLINDGNSTLAKIFICVLAATVGTAFLTNWLWKNRENALLDRGTAYIVEEAGTGWQTAENGQFRALVESRFAQVLNVPGPCAMHDWRWPIEPTQAADWQRNVDRLVESFAHLRYNDDELTANGLIVTAHWPVAMSFGARLRSIRRGLSVAVYQRPSHGRTAEVKVIKRSRLGIIPKLQDPHDFTKAAPESLAEEWHGARIEIIGRGSPEAEPSYLHVNPTNHHDAADAPPENPHIVLVRLLPATWGPGYGVQLDRPSEDKDIGPIDCAAPLTLQSGRYRFTELRLVDGSGAIFANQLDWSMYPALVDAVVVGVKSLNLTGTVLMGVLAPGEVALGIGMRSAAPDVGGMFDPATKVYPLVSQVADRRHIRFVIPNLELNAR
ncbi:hypothetical protein [Gordonia bronchialis]|uniref:hypothetical protein n=1 Tax=Gordonia bronchialis TaxID=2054 RepID=UPI00226ECC55|nr:hypothetical protein [Gordonia bronchialis]